MYSYILAIDLLKQNEIKDLFEGLKEVFVKNKKINDSLIFERFINKIKKEPWQTQNKIISEAFYYCLKKLDFCHIIISSASELDLEKRNEILKNLINIKIEEIKPYYFTEKGLFVFETCSVLEGGYTITDKNKDTLYDQSKLHKKKRILDLVSFLYDSV